MMKRYLFLLMLLAATTFMSAAVPPSPQWIEHLAEQGDTASIRMLYNRFLQMEKQRYAVLSEKQSRVVQTARPLKLAPRGLVIMVNFTDLAFQNSREDMDQMLNGEHYVRDYYSAYTQKKIHSEGSARQYFIDQSMGQYTPQFDVVGPYTVSHNMAYYGRNSFSGEDMNVKELVIEACQLAVANGVNMSDYDRDNDGTVDYVVIYYAGYGEANGGSDDTIWPHSYALENYGGASAWFYLDGKRINDYCCFNEMSYLSGQHEGIGTFVHEYSHVMGLPDLYATSYGSHKTMGRWDVLDSGPYNNDGNTPPAYSAYERFFCGWLTPQILNQPATIALEQLQQSNEAYLISQSGTHNMQGRDPVASTFYLLENRQKLDWDAYIPGHGLLITKIQYSFAKWEWNRVNDDANHMGVDLIEADGKETRGSAGKQGDAFPYYSSKEEVNYFTPYEQYPITNIQEREGVIWFDFMGGADRFAKIVLDEANADSQLPFRYIVAVYDRAGNILMEGEDLVIRDLPAGFYIVRTYTGEGTERDQYKSVKLVIQ